MNFTNNTHATTLNSKEQQCLHAVDRIEGMETLSLPQKYKFHKCDKMSRLADAVKDIK